MITDPLFYLLAIPAVTLLGLSKGGFAGLGMVTTPMLALIMPPLQAAAILLPLLIVQDAISVWTYRRAWSAWNLKVLMPGAVLGTRLGLLADQHRLLGHTSGARVRGLDGDERRGLGRGRRCGLRRWRWSRRKCGLGGGGGVCERRRGVRRVASGT